MGTPAKQIGWSTESNLLQAILKQVNQLTSVVAASGGGGGGVSGTGTIGTIPMWSSATGLTDSQITETGGRIAIGPFSSASKLVIGGSSLTGENSFSVHNTEGATGSITIAAGITGVSDTGMEFFVDAFQKMYLTDTGNLVIGYPADNGNKLQVNGIGTFTGGLEVIIIDGFAPAQLKVVSDSSGGILLVSSDLSLFPAIMNFNADNYSFITSSTDSVSFDSAANLFAVTLRTRGFTVGSLPSGNTGMRAYVSDADTPVFGSPVVGGGAVVIPVFYDGTTWIVG